MKRILILLTLVIIGVAAFVLNGKSAETITLLDARAVPSAMNDKMFMVGLRIENSGPADRLIGVSSPSAMHLSVMNPASDTAALIIPQDSAGILAMDGAHIMLMPRAGSFDEGGFIPLDLEFENAGTVSVRVRNAGASTMDHSLENGIVQTPSPGLTIAWETPPTEQGATVRLSTENFTFIRTKDDAAHTPNHGHAHVYLNGLKLGRLYEPMFELGALAAGDYTLSIALNSNDHRPYVRDGQSVSAALEFTITP
ncbi:copper chaperone PCu(A)C [Sulfitobacter sp. HNIBRBA2951]|uniref:copper chaperone PCu(A)C n=1 Tax=Sulfitobacter aquimarinus TaxID=3158557 RepID=UPI0032DE98A8